MAMNNVRLPRYPRAWYLRRKPVSFHTPSRREERYRDRGEFVYPPKDVADSRREYGEFRD